MTIYFYHTEDLQYEYAEWEKGEFPGHLLYGATHLKDFGIDMIMHKHVEISNRVLLALNTFWQIIMCCRSFKVIYATHYKGLEILIFLRALGLFNKPIVVWHHQPIITPSNKLRDLLGRLFYRGMDHLFFFSQKLYDDSLVSKKKKKERMHVGHWGADLDFYDTILSDSDTNTRCGFISTGKEKRDMTTLVKAFNATGASLDIYLNKMNGTFSYENLFKNLETRDNIQVHFISGLIPNKLSELVNQSMCVVICCKETKYTVGLTTVVEALALRLPVICSRNPQIPIDFDKEGCGISVPYYDAAGWINAIEYITSHPDEASEMGRKGRELAGRLFNDRQCAKEVADVILSL